MAFDIAPYVNAMSVGASASSITGNTGDAFGVGAYAAFVQSITGSVPTVVENGSSRAKVVLSSDQAVKMRSWLEQKIASKEIPRVSYELGPVVNPIVLKYTLPVGILLFAAGFIAARYLIK